jgi:hypothetical protein
MAPAYPAAVPPKHRVRSLHHMPLPTGFTPVVASPLLIRRVANPGGAGGRRIHLGTLSGGWAIAVQEHRKEPAVRTYGEALAVVHAYNGELDRARRDGLASRPEAVALTVATLERAATAAERS